MSQIRLRQASIADLDVLQYWDTQLHVIAADPNDDWLWPTELRRNPDWRQQFIAELDRRPLGFLQIIDPAREESHYWGEVEDDLRAIDMWIGKSEDLGKGYGTEIMRQALALCFAPPRVSAVLVDPLANNARALRFYEKTGFTLLDRRTFGDDDCFVYQITRARWLLKRAEPSSC